MDIKIAKKLKDDNDPSKGHKLEPSEGRRTPVKPRELVTFTMDPNAGVAGLSITFTDRSPFGAEHKAVKYGNSHVVTAAFDADGTRNIYTYSCETADGLSSENGGEMEVIRP